MNQRNKKFFIIIPFIFLWIILIFFVYQKYNTQEGKISEIILERTKYQSNKDQEKILQEESIIEETLNTTDTLFLDESVVSYLKTQDIQDFKTNTSDQNNFFTDTLDELCGSFPCYSSRDFLKMYEDFENSFSLNKEAKAIYGIAEVDMYIQEIAKLRGYKKHVFANKSDIIDFEEIKTRADVRDAYISLRDELKKQGISLYFVSGYRDEFLQARILKNKIGEIEISDITSGIYDEQIMKGLDISALPGYSKHHSGFAVDFGCGNDYLVYNFADTECYTWLSKNNFENSKRFGFLPSYPNGVSDQGPNPEPWEFVWVGVDTIKNYTK